MINDIFTDEFLGKIEQWTKSLAPMVGYLILVAVAVFFVGRLRGDIQLLQAHSSTGSSKSATERLTEIKAEQSTTATAMAIMDAATSTPAPTEESIVDDIGEANDNAASPGPAVPEVPAETTELFGRGACIGCHVIPGIPGAVGAIGPDLATIGTVGAQRVEGLDADEYIYESLVDPQAYIAPECPMGACPSGVMLPTFVQALNESEIEQMVNYLVSLQ